MQRREFITLMGGAAVAWPLAARAQQRPIPVIGFLNMGSPGPFTHLLAAFREGLNEAGYVEGQNVAVEYRWAEGGYDRLPELAADLVRHQVAVIVATGGEPAALAAKAATKTIPIVFVVGEDPVALGLVASFNRPGGNATGLALLAYSATTKRWELLREMVPGAASIAVLAKTGGLSSQIELKQLQAAAGTLGQPINVLYASNEPEIDAAFDNLVAQRAGALFVATEAFFTNRRDQIIALAARHAIPTSYPFREFVAAGGLMSYGPSLTDIYRQVALYAGRVVKGATPADLPVQSPTKFEHVINLKTAKALGLTVPLTLQVAADEVIE
jgi:putative tryptophan/tyrosine transport system substrate-binding protein